MGTTCVRRAVSVLALVAGSTVAIGQVDIFWQNPGGGQWDDGSNWSLQTVPDNDNGDGVLFNVFVSLLSKQTYTVVLSTNRRVSNYTQDSFLTTLQANARLTVDQSLFLDDGEIVSGKSGSVVVQGASTLRNSRVAEFSGNGFALLGGSTIDNVTFENNAQVELGGVTEISNTSFAFNQSVLSTGTLNLGGNGSIDICDTCFDHVGGAVNWNTSASINLEGDSDFNNGSGSTFTIDSSKGSGQFVGVDGSQTFTNNGTLLKLGSDTTLFTNVNFINNERVRVQEGKLAADGVQLMLGGGGSAAGAGATLMGGRWEIADGAGLDLIEQQIFGLQAEVRLEGPESTFEALDTLGFIAGNGVLELVDGRNFTTQENFFVATGGKLFVGEGSTFEVSGELFNFGPGSFNQGEFEIQGTLVANNFGIQVINNVVTLDGQMSQIIDSQGNDAFSALQQIGETGVLTLRNGRTIENIEQLEVFGQLIIEGGPQRGMLDTGISVFGAYRQFSGQTLLNNGFLVAGGGVEVSNTVLGGSGRIVGNVDMTESTLLIGGPLEIVGDLNMRGLSADAIPTIVADGFFGAGVPSLIVAGDVTLGVEAGFDSSARLVLSFDKSLGLQVGDEIRLIEANSFVGEFVEIVGAQIGTFLRFDVLTDATGVTLRVVPAPGAVAMLAMAGVLAGRRRRG